jgi:hypothetical protein
MKSIEQPDPVRLSIILNPASQGASHAEGVPLEPSDPGRQPVRSIMSKEFDQHPDKE